jgi:hypothetical protein
MHQTPVIHVDSTLPEATVVRWALSHLANEVSNPGPGAELMIDHLAHVMFVQAPRTYLQSTDASIGWLGAQSDSNMAVALVASLSSTTHFIRYPGVKKAPG